MKTPTKETYTKEELRHMSMVGDLSGNLFGGPPPGVVLDKTKGKPAHFYYVCLLINWALVMPALLYFEKQTDPFFESISKLIVEYVSHDQENTVLPFFLLLFLFIICLRPVIFPIDDDGQADWRWKST